MKTFKRIEEIAKATEFASKQFKEMVIIADIATDHGFIAERVSSFKNVKKVIATDISEKSLNKLEKLILLKGLSKIETLVGDGLCPISSADICIIAGIGGFEIRKMIENQNKDTNDTNKCNIFVLQPAQNAVELREWIFQNRFKVLKDFIIEDSERFYPIIVIDVSRQEENESSIFNLWIGRDSRENYNDYVSFLEYLREYLCFIEEISPERAVNDKMLFQKCELYKNIDKYLTEK